jgi:predicted NBD/HSP70 family sugar kinase
MRAMNERALVEHVRRAGPVSRAELGRVSGLSKPTVGLALANLERDGLIRVAGRRTGTRGPAAALYEVRPEAGFVLGLDVGRQYLRGALADLTGAVLARTEVKVRVGSGHDRIAELARLAETLRRSAGLHRSDVTQTVLGSPGVYDPRRGALRMAPGIPGWERREVLTELTEAFGPAVTVDNDVNLAAVAEKAYGHGREVGSLAFLSVGTGIGVGLIVEGRLHRGAHGAAGEIAFLPLDGGLAEPTQARRHGTLEAAASAAAVVRAARHEGMRGAVSSRRVFAAAAAGDPKAQRVVDQEAVVVAKAIAAVVAVADPELVVLGGGIGQAPGFAEAVHAKLPGLAPVLPEVRVSALGVDAVVTGCLAAGIDQAWDLLTAASA